MFTSKTKMNPGAWSPSAAGEFQQQQPACNWHPLRSIKNSSSYQALNYLFRFSMPGTSDIRLRFLFGALLLLLSMPFAVGAEALTISPESVIELTNQERTARNLPPLAVSEELTEAAYAKAHDMLRRQYFAHAEWEQFIRRAGYYYCSAGENLGLNQTEAGELVGEWMDSPTHRANLLKGKYREIGVAVVRGNYKGFDVIIIVQMFGARCL